MLRYIKISLFIFLLIPGLIKTQSRDELLLKGIDHVYKIEFDSAIAIFQPIADADPKDPTGPFFLAMTEWWRVYLNKEDHSNDDNYLNKVSKCVKLCEERIDANENDDWAVFLLGGVIGYRGFINSIRENWLSAVDDGREGLNLLQRSYELNRNNIDAVFGIGLYNYAAEYVVNRYPFLKAVLFFFPQGNRELGLQQLRDCAERGKFTRTEAKVVLCFIHLSYEKNYPEAIWYASRLVEMYPQNPLFNRFLGKCYVGTNNWPVSDSIYASILAKNDSGLFGYNSPYVKREACYYYAMGKSKMFDLNTAFKYYDTSYNISKELDKDKPSAYQVFSLLSMGAIFDQWGNHDEAVKYYDRVLEMRDIENSHETAKTYKEKGIK